MTERELFEIKYKELTGCDDFSLSRKKDGDYKFDGTYFGWLMWQASANRQGYKLVPVDTLEECLNWAACASSESWSDEQRDEIDKHYKVIEKAMIGAVE